MYSAGNIIYFTPFYFQDGSPSKPKYFIVLRSEENKTLVVSLPSSVDSVPSMLNIEHGCINSDDHNFNCYHFAPDTVVTANGFSFKLPTFVYGEQIGEYQLQILESLYKVENIEYQIIGKLLDKEYQALISCFLSSRVVKTKFKNKLKQA